MGCSKGHERSPRLRLYLNTALPASFRPSNLFLVHLDRIAIGHIEL